MAEAPLPERTRGKRGIKSKATIRDNAYDRKFHTHHATLTFPDETNVPYSLNKGKRWEQVEELKQQIADGDDQVVFGDGAIKEVMEVQIHPREEVGSLSWQHLGQRPRRGFSGGTFSKEKRGRDYTRVEVLVCSECGGDQVFPPRQGEEPENWYRKQTPEEVARMRKERKEKEEKDKERRAARKQRHAPRVEKKDLRKEQLRKDTDEAADETDATRDGDEEDERENETSGQESEEPLVEGGDGEDEEDEEGEYESSGDDDEEDEDDEDDDEEEAEEEEEEEVESVVDKEGEKEAVTVEEEGQNEGDKEEEGKDEEGKVIHSQERNHVAAKPGRVIVNKPFEKGQYPMYRETNWKYSSPCMCCLHSQGPMWILKGMGEKSKRKTKGFRKIQRRDFKNTLKGEI